VKSSRHFGRRISMPSKIQIKRELMTMCMAEKLCSDLHSEGVTSHELSSIMKELIEQDDISPERANYVSDMHRARNVARSAA